MSAEPSGPRAAPASGFDAGPVACRLLVEDDRGLYRALFGSSAVMTGIGPVLDARQADLGFANALAHNRNPPTQARARFWRIVEAAGGADAGLLAMVREPATAADVELGVMLLPAWQRRGLGRAAVAAAIAHLRAVLPGVGGFTARTAHDNAAAAALFRGLGFIQTAERGAKPAGPPHVPPSLRYWRLPADAWPMQRTSPGVAHPR